MLAVLRSFVHAAILKSYPTFPIELVRYKDQDWTAHGDPVVALEVMNVREEFRSPRTVTAPNGLNLDIVGYSKVERFELQVQVESISHTSEPSAIDVAQKLRLAVFTETARNVLKADPNQELTLLSFLGPLQFHRSKGPDNRTLSTWTFDIPFRAEFFLAETVPNPLQYTIGASEGTATLDTVGQPWSTE